MFRGSIEFTPARWLAGAVVVLTLGCGASDAGPSTANQGNGTAANPTVTPAASTPATPAPSQAENGSTAEPATRPAPLETPESPTSVFQGVYTASQAARGQELFSTHCTMCHQVGQFTVGTLRIDERYATLGDLFLTVTTLMPMDNPGGLAYHEYAAIISYFLSSKGLPEGTRELPADVNQLLRIGFDPPEDGD
ncbi:MAG TPA: hypothetical protein VNZ57_02430 [Longimicrobiales bacterium]|nr:hypothetical protein [Longimicrobiales bacterium]